MDNNSPILDYASPRKRLSLRLPARSILYCNIQRDEIVLVETLAGKEGVIPALIFAMITQAASLLFIAASATSVRKLIANGGLIPLALVLVQIPLMLVIIHQTWRKTRLTVRFNQLLLDFTSPLQGKHYRWTGDEIADMLLIETANTQTEMPLAELLITRASGGEIHLFTDHRAEEIKRLIQILPPMLREGQQPSAASSVVPTTIPPVVPPPVPVPPVDPSVNALQTSARLVDLHRDLRNKSK